MKKILFSFFSLLLFIINALTASGTKHENSASFTVGTASGYAPFVSLTPKGEYEGFDIDVIHALAEKLNKQLILKDFGSMTSLIMALKMKKVDAIIWAISITEERSREMELIHYQGEKETTLPFFFWKEVPKGIEKIEDLGKDKSKVISIEAGTSQESILQNYPTINMKNVDRITDAVMDVKYGKSLAVAVDPSLVATLHTQNPELKLKELPVPPHLQVQGFGIGVSKNNVQLSNEIYKKIAELKNEGVILKLEKKWNLVE